MRLLAERTGLRAGLSAAMARRGFDPVYDRGQVLIDMAVTQILVVRRSATSRDCATWGR